MNNMDYRYLTRKEPEQTCCNESSCCSTEQPTNQCTIKIGRNDPCICGSGKKFKKCCGKNQ